MLASADAVAAPRHRARGRAGPSAGTVTLWSVDIVVVLFLLAPILIIVVAAFSDEAFLRFPPRGWSLRWFETFFGNRDFLDSTLLSVELAVLSAVIATAIGVMAALALANAQFRGAELARTVIVAPIIVPSIVLGLSLLIFYASLRLNGTLPTLIVTHIVLTIPYVVRIVSAGLQAYDRSVEAAASSLGANPGTVFRTMTLPLLKGSIVSGLIFALITSFDEVTTTLFLIGPTTTTLPVRVFTYVEYNSDPLIAAVSTIQLVMAVVVVVVVERSIGFVRFLH